MFTGIIEEVGTIKGIKKGARSCILTIGGKKVLEGTKVGDSIALNGVCLTVTDLLSDCFLADVMHETLNRSALAGLGSGQHVNLERAMPANGRFGGHIVAGHVDGVGKVMDIRRDDTAVWYTIQAEAPVLRYIVEKGSVAVDGISLTVAQTGEDWFSFSAIPHTVEHTVLKERRKGSLVNLETDMIGKYVEKLLGGGKTQKPGNVITKEFLEKYGF